MQILKRKYSDKILEQKLLKLYNLKKYSTNEKRVDYLLKKRKENYVGHILIISK